ncbi:MAG: phage tail tape measure protein [Candidatus Competibacter sp.]|nr:phage tail tape measure protein [Candidatus Competibacter sp.]
MAGTSVVVDLLLKARDLASAPIRGIVASIKFLDSEISVVAGKIRDAFSGLFGGSLDGAIEFEAQLSKVAAKGSFTAAEMETLKQAATDIGARFGATGTEAAQGMEALAAAGLNATEVMQALPPVLALAKAEGISMDAAAEKLSDSLAAVGLGFDQAARMADVLAKGANLSTTSASALADALATAGGIAKTAGLNLEQTVAALSELASAGIKGEKAGTALQAILTQLINPASQASRELSALGITSRDLGTVIGQLAAKGEASNAAILAFGETAGPGLRALVGQGSQALAEMTGQLGNSTGAAEAAATGINNNLKGALTALEAAWANVKTALAEPVLQPLAQAARDAAEVLKTQLASGALKPVQEAIRTFAATGIQAARDFIAGFDFKAALANVQDFAAGARETFGGLKDAGVQAASAVQIAWNGFTAGLKTIGASLLAVAASAVSNVAAIEEAASKIGLGSLARANELRTTASELAAKAGELTQSIAKDGEDIRGAFDRLAATTDGAADGLNRVAAAQKDIQDASPVAEITEITRSLDDYRQMADRANTAAEQARRDQEAGTISAAEYGVKLAAAADANAELAAATERAAAAERQAVPQRRQSAVELQSVAKAAQDTADRQGDYIAALEKAAGAQTDAIRAEIDLALAKGDVATAAGKSVELAKVEADWAARIAAAKQAEAAELQKVVAAQQAYLQALGGGTQAQQQELQILQLKLVAMQAEAEQAGKTAEAKKIAAQQAEANSIADQQNTKDTQQHTAAVDENTAALEKNKQEAEASAGAAKTFAGFIAKVREEVAALSDQALAALDRKLSALAQTSSASGFRDLADSVGLASAEVEKLQQHVEDAQAAFRYNAANSLFATGIGQFMEQLKAAQAEVIATYYQQRLAVEQVKESVDAMTQAGVYDLGTMKLATEAVNGSFGLLKNQDLDALRSSIEKANESLRKMQEAAQSAKDRLAELNAEIAREKGDTATSDRLKLELEQRQALAEVEANLAKARAEQNQELIRLYEEQRQKLQELYDLKERNLEQEQRQAAAAAASNANASSGAGSSGSQSASGGAGISTGRSYTLNLVAPSGNALTANTDTDPAAFLDELERTRLRSLA